MARIELALHPRLGLTAAKFSSQPAGRPEQTEVMIRSVERALAVLDAFDADHQSLTLQEIGRRTGIPKATTFRLVSSLQEAGYLIRDSQQQFSLSLKVTRLAGLVLSTTGIRDIARPIMAEVSAKTGETVTLNARLGDERICIDVVETPATLMTIIKPGEHVSLAIGAIAQMFLAYSPETEVERIISAHSMTRSAKAALKNALAQFRKDGYAISTGQRVAGLTAIAVPIFDAKDEVHHTMGITGPSSRMDTRTEMLAEIMLNAARRISILLGCSPARTHKNQAASSWVRHPLR